MRSLIDNLSAWAGIGANDAAKTDCDLDEIARQTLTEIRESNPGKTINARWEYLPVVVGNKREYEQVFAQVFKNSVCYSKENENVQINITSGELTPLDAVKYDLDTGTNYTRIDVKDEGIGFAQEFANKIFRPFTRLHGKSEYPGTGMGLAICKKIVEKNGGTMFAEAEENKGATFTLILPQSL